MSKFPKAICPKCKRPLKRHDPERLDQRIKTGTWPYHQTLTYHLDCR